MGSYKCALQLWRRKQSDLVGVLPKISRAFHTQKTTSDQVLGMVQSGVARQSTAHSSHLTRGIVGTDGISVLSGRKFTSELINTKWAPLQLTRNYGANNVVPRFSRTMSSEASQKPRRNRSETKKDISTVEEPFDDAPTYNIPQKPLTFVEGASYSVVILIGFGIAGLAAYAVFKELIFEPKEYKIFNKALKRIQDDAQVRMRVGYPITGYGQESRNRAARQRIPNRMWTDEDGLEHVEVNFYVRGPHGAGKVFAEMFKDVDKRWKYTYLVVETTSPSQSRLILESYLPEYKPAP
ncbi:putative mitochondrial import inner membrane translocase subunit TIM21 [Rosa sericea]